MIMRLRPALVALGVLLAASGCNGGGDGASPLAAPKAGEWARHGFDLSESRFSPLDELTPQTVGNLKLAWFHDLDTNRGQEATPIMADGKLFTTSAWSKVQAFDAASGKVLWTYRPQGSR